MVTRCNSDKARCITWQWLNIECRVREVITTTIQRFLLRAIWIHMHCDTREVVCQIGVLPPYIHHLTVIGHCGVPVSILVECQTTHITILRVIEYHITYRIFSIHTWHSLIANIRSCDKLTIWQERSIRELQIKLIDLENLTQTFAINTYLEDIKLLPFIGRRKEQSISIPVQHQI